MGRPRKFDVEKSIQIAADLFWRKGYDGASLADLTQAMGVAPPSLYAAFGGKEALFLRVVADYSANWSRLAQEALERPHIADALEALLGGFADFFTDGAHAPGCLILNNALPIDAAHPFRATFAEQREAFKAALQSRLERAAQAESFRDGFDAAAAARMLVALLWGFAVEAQSGVSRDVLRAAATIAIASLLSAARTPA